MDDKCDELKVQFVDYGNIEIVPVTDTRKAAFVTSVPVQSFKCMFSSIMPLGKNNRWSTDDLDIIHGSMVDKKCKIILKEIPKQGQLVKVASLVTELNRDMVDYLISNDKAMFLPEIPTLIVSDDDDSKENEVEPLQRFPRKSSKKTSEMKKRNEKLSSTLTNTDTSEPMQGIEIVSETPAVPIVQKNNTQKVISCSISEESMEDTENGDKIVKDVSQQPSESETVMQATNEQQARTDDTMNVVVMRSQDLIDLEIEHSDPMLDRQGQSMDVTNSSHISMSEKSEIISLDDDMIVIDETDGSSFESHPICLSSSNASEESHSDLKKLPSDVEDKFLSLIIEDNTPLLMEVSTVISAVEFFLRPSFILEKSDPVQSLAKEMSMGAAKLPPLQNISIGQTCCAKYGNEYYRAAVVDVAADCKTATVAFVDYGNMEALPVSDLRELDDCWYALPRQALKCVASGIEVVAGADKQLLFEEVSNALQSGPIFVIFKKRSEPSQVELLMQDQETSVYAKMIEMKLVKVVPEEKEEEKNK